MKIRFNKVFTVIGIENRVSKEKKIPYGILKVFDENGDLNSVYVKSDMVSNIKGLTHKQEISTVVEITANVKFQKLELISIVK